MTGKYCRRSRLRESRDSLSSVLYLPLITLLVFDRLLSIALDQVQISCDSCFLSKSCVVVLHDKVLYLPLITLLVSDRLLSIALDQIGVFGIEQEPSALLRNLTYHKFKKKKKLIAWTHADTSGRAGNSSSSLIHQYRGSGRKNNVSM